MFRWYQEAAACYVYLFDVASASGETAIASSRWFNRGWTLQELIAPSDVRFYSSAWGFIGTKESMRSLISATTNIDAHILAGGDLETISVARRMSWVSKRKTSRVEDMAYCLLGIFDINMPLIYGEGRKAFQRLQEAIMLNTHDQSLFAWGRLVDHPSDVISEDEAVGAAPLRWKPPSERPPLLGLFADGPELFASSADIASTHPFSHELRRTHPPALLSGGVCLGLVNVVKFLSAMHLDRPALAVPTWIRVVVLLCRIGTSENRLVGLVLRHWGEGYSGRTPELVVLKMSVSTMRFKSAVRPRHIMKERPLKLCDGDIVFRRMDTPFEVAVKDRDTTPSGPAWREIYWGKSIRVLRLANDAVGSEAMCYNFRTEALRGIAVEFNRSKGIQKTAGHLTVSLFPIKFRRPLTDDERQFFKLLPEAVNDGSLGPTFTHTMTAPLDAWALEAGTLPRVYIRVERKELEGQGGGAVDIIDFFMYPEGRDADRARSAITSDHSVS